MVVQMRLWGVSEGEGDGEKGKDNKERGSEMKKGEED